MEVDRHFEQPVVGAEIMPRNGQTRGTRSHMQQARNFRIQRHRADLLTRFDDAFVEMFFDEGVDCDFKRADILTDRAVRGGNVDLRMRHRQA